MATGYIACASSTTLAQLGNAHYELRLTLTAESISFADGLQVKRTTNLLNGGEHAQQNIEL